MHPAEEIRGSKSTLLQEKRIVLGVTGSIAAVESVRLARELIRHGAEVIPLMTSAATKIIHPDCLEFATGHKPILELTGKLEHVTFCGKVKEPADLLLISPCTANTISKIAHGIDDTPVTTFATTAIGAKIPILLVPAMHLSMYDHSIIQENILHCKKNGISFVDPVVEGNKAKIATVEMITAMVIRTIGKNDLTERNILIIGGSTAEPVDDVRVITNRSSGKTAVALAKTAFHRGGNVTLWYGESKEHVPPYISTTRFTSIHDVIKLTRETDMSSFDIILVCAALPDYLPEKTPGKITSQQKNLKILLNPAPRVLPQLRNLSPNAQLIGFKVETHQNMLITKAKKLLKDNTLDYVIANTVQTFEKDAAEIWVLDKSGTIHHFKGEKEDLANHIFDKITEK